jgi:hypothetical protein
MPKPQKRVGMAMNSIDVSTLTGSQIARLAGAFSLMVLAAFATYAYGAVSGILALFIAAFLIQFMLASPFGYQPIGLRDLLPVAREHWKLVLGAPVVVLLSIGVGMIVAGGAAEHFIECMGAYLGGGLLAFWLFREATGAVLEGTTEADEKAREHISLLFSAMRFNAEVLANSTVLGRGENYIIRPTPDEVYESLESDRTSFDRTLAILNLAIGKWGREELEIAQAKIPAGNPPRVQRAAPAKSNEFTEIPRGAMFA